MFSSFGPWRGLLKPTKQLPNESFPSAPCNNNNNHLLGLINSSPTVPGSNFFFVQRLPNLCFFFPACFLFSHNVPFPHRGPLPASQQDQLTSVLFHYGIYGRLFHQRKMHERVSVRGADKNRANVMSYTHTHTIHMQTPRERDTHTHTPPVSTYKRKGGAPAEGLHRKLIGCCWLRAGMS